MTFSTASKSPSKWWRDAPAGDLLLPASMLLLTALATLLATHHLVRRMLRD